MMGMLGQAEHAVAELREKISKGTVTGDNTVGRVEEEIRAAVENRKQKTWPSWLPMPNPDLCKDEPPVDIVGSQRGLKQQLATMKTKLGHVWPPAFIAVLENSISHLDEADRQVSHIEAQPNASGHLAKIPQPIFVKLQELSLLGSELDITTPNKNIEQLRTQLAAVTSRPTDNPDSIGNMGWTKVQIQTKIIDNLKDIIRSIEAAELENQKIDNLTDLRRSADMEVASLKEPNWSLKIQCTSSLASVKQSLDAMKVTDQEASSEFAQRMATSKRKVAANTERQQQVWREMNQLFEELGGLAIERSGEINWQVDAMEKELSRKAEHTWGEQVANENIRRLEETYNFAVGSIACIEGTEKIIAEAVDTALHYKDNITQDLNQQKYALLTEVENEIATLQSWSDHHRGFVSDVLRHTH
eukprot:TRINITY_DN20641_c0_g1_i1.p1 TRINITY_DN20641_c0_g1~~TRINITY_DN20641_c0_g1_i1.p1  ORF type:complete len:453 (+),score=104.15 TRINITY_DN20641_c0_g1_i1:113-1360(+)